MDTKFAIDMALKFCLIFNIQVGTMTKELKISTKEAIRKNDVRPSNLKKSSKKGDPINNNIHKVILTIKLKVKVVNQTDLLYL